MKEAQPAKKSYFFEKGYKDVKNTIIDAWNMNLDSAKKLREKIKDLKFKDINKVKKIFFYILNYIALISIVVFGSIIIAVMSTLNIVILAVVMACIYIGFSILWLVDRIYLQKNRIFTACTECNSRFMIPTYVCPKCGAKHTNLTPGVYGILHRKCTGVDGNHSCGEKLPTTFLNGRNKLPAICPGCNAALSNRGSVPLCIAIVGGRSVGKTAFLNAFSKNFMDEVAPSCEWETEFYDNKKENMYSVMLQDFESGNTTMTEHKTGKNEVSTNTFSFFIQGENLKRERLVHLYDIAGEVFSDQNIEEYQTHLSYCQGIVFVLDPLSIPAIKSERKEDLSAEDQAGISGSDIDEVYGNFLNKLREATGLSDQKMSQIPLAIVISKMDAANIAEEIGAKAITTMMREEKEVFDDYFNTEDYLCRDFLRKHGLANFVNSVESRFAVNRFFSCSAMGHARGQGEYKPVGVVQPMQWIFGRADEEIGNIWNTVKFSKEIPIIEVNE